MNEGFTPSQLNNRDLDRFKSYTKLLDFYQGKHWEKRAVRGEKQLTFNYAKTLVDKTTNYLMSNATTAVEAIEDSDDARTTPGLVPRGQSKPCKPSMSTTTWSSWTLTPRLIVPSWATPVLRSSGTRRRRESGLQPPMSRASMPGGWGTM